MERREDSGVRILRLQELIREELSGLLRDDVEDPAVSGVVVAAVVLSADYRHARVHYALRNAGDDVAGRRAEVDRALARATPFLRARLADAIDLKRVPDLRFVFDAATADSA